MAKSKTKTAKKTTAKKAPVKKSAKRASKPTRRAAKTSAPVLTMLARQRLLKPTGDLDTVGEDTVTQWKANGKYIKVPDLTAAGLATQLRAAKKAADKESAYLAKVNPIIQAFADARLLAGDVATRSLLDVYAEVKSSGRRRPELLDAFESLADFASRGGGGRSDPGDDGGGGGSPPPAS